MAEIYVTLNTDNISKAVKDLDNYEQLLDKAVADGIAELGERMYLKINEYLDLYQVDSTFNLRSSIQIIPTPTGFSITVGADYAMFVEYGTGIVGSANPHPMPNNAGWIYDVNGHGDSGWWYPTTYDDPNPTIKMCSDGQLRAWTKSSPAKPFMYKTWLWAKRSYANIIHKHIRRISV